MSKLEFLADYLADVMISIGVALFDLWSKYFACCDDKFDKESTVIYMSVILPALLYCAAIYFAPIAVVKLLAIGLMIAVICWLNLALEMYVYSIRQR